LRADRITLRRFPALLLLAFQFLDHYLIRARPRRMIVDRGSDDELVNAGPLDKFLHTPAHSFRKTDKRIGEHGAILRLFCRNPVDINVVGGFGSWPAIASYNCARRALPKM
jgi:hypothetical protein